MSHSCIRVQVCVSVCEQVCVCLCISVEERPCVCTSLSIKQKLKKPTHVVFDSIDTIFFLHLYCNTPPPPLRSLSTSSLPLPLSLPPVGKITVLLASQRLMNELINELMD